MSQERTCRVCGQPLTRRQRKFCSPPCFHRSLVKADPSYSACRRRAQRLVPVLIVCEACGTTEHLQRHHRDRDPLNNTPENIAVLCRSCHMKLHWSDLGMTRAPRPRVTHCKHGHPYDDANTYWYADGVKRACRACRRAGYHHHKDGGNP